MQQNLALSRPRERDEAKAALVRTDIRDLKRATAEVQAAEQRAMDAISESMAAIMDLFDGTPHNWENEGIPAIHILQGFVLAHWAHRVNPEYWSDWKVPQCKARNDEPRL